MRKIEAKTLGGLVESLCLEVSTDLPDDVVTALGRAREEERSPAGRRALDAILENAAEARRLSVPLCQDTGIFAVFLRLGRDTLVEGDFAAEVSGAVARATAEGALRPSVVSEPLEERGNTGDNTPPLLHVEFAPDGETTLAVMAKGGGCEMASAVTMLPPGAGWSGVVDFATRLVGEVGACSCPPLALGVAVGGSFDTAPSLAKRALLVPLDRDNPDPGAGEREKELLRAVNRLGIGPGAMGGTVTCLGVRLVEAPCHMATLPVAVNVSCHSLRRKTIKV